MMRIRQKSNQKSENTESAKPDMIEVRTDRADHPIEIKKDNGLLRFVKKIIENPNVGFQIMAIILTLTCENGQMERRIDGMSTTVDKLRDITELLNKTIGSVKIAAETPRKIRQLLDDDFK